MDPPALCSATGFISTSFYFTHSFPLLSLHLPINNVLFFFPCLFYCCHNYVVEKKKLIWSLKLYLKALKGSHSKHLPCWHPSKWKPVMDTPQCVGLRHRWQHFCMQVILLVCHRKFECVCTWWSLISSYLFCFSVGMRCIQSSQKGLFHVACFPKEGKATKVPWFMIQFSFSQTSSGQLCPLLTWAGHSLNSSPKGALGGKSH